MSNSSRQLKQLEKELLALGEESMLIETLDGFLAGVLVCPELIKPGEWLPLVWGEAGGDAQPVFDNPAHANRVLRLVMDHYNGIARTLMERSVQYRPLFPIDERNGDIIWEVWVEGFAKAVELRPDAWQGLLGADAETAAAAMRGMLTLVDAVCGDWRGATPEALQASAPGNIARWIVALNAWRLAHDRPSDRAAAMPPSSREAARKIGRNDPCPCGSGKKYKRCCGLN